MKIVLQRVQHAKVSVDDEVVGAIGQGVLLLVCIEHGDTHEGGAYLARKIAHMRIFTDADGKMNRSMLDISGQALVVSQFTLAAEWRQGNRPGFSKAARPDVAVPLLDAFIEQLQDHGVPVATGQFGAHMAIELCNDGPVTIILDTAQA